MAIPVVVEQKLNGSFLGLSGMLSTDALTYAEPIVVDLKFDPRRNFYRLATTGYALVLEALYDFPVNIGCVVYAHSNMGGGRLSGIFTLLVMKCDNVLLRNVMKRCVLSMKRLIQDQNLIVRLNALIRLSALDEVVLCII